MIYKLKKHKIKINRISLLVFVIALVLGGIYYWYSNYSYNKQFISISLYFSDKHFSKLLLEKRKIKRQNTKNNILTSLNQLIYGPLSSSHKNIIPRSTRIKSMWYSKGNLYINFSKELVKNINPKIKNTNLVISSILTTLFTSFKKINTIELFVEDKPLKTILGKNEFSKRYKRKTFIKNLNSI